MMVKRGGTLIETTRVPRVSESELLEIEMVTELVAKGARECAERSDLLANRRPHPDPDHGGFWIVVTEKLECPAFTDAQGSCCKDADGAVWDLIET